MSKGFEFIEKQEAYELIIENHPSIIMLLEEKSGRVLDANRAATDFYGYTKEEFKDLFIYDINNYTKEQIQSEIMMAAAQKRNSFHFLHQMKDQTLADVEVTSYPIVIDNVNVLLSMIRPAEGEDCFRDTFDVMDFFEGSDEAICLLEGQDIQRGRVVYSNQSFAILMGIRREHISQMLAGDLFDFDEEAINWIVDENILLLKDPNRTVVTVHHMDLRFLGKNYQLLTVKLMDFETTDQILVDEEFFGLIDQAYKKQEGRLVGVRIYTSKFSRAAYDEYKGYIYETLVKAFDDSDLKFLVSRESDMIYLYTGESLDRISKVLSEFQSIVEYDPVFNPYNATCKYKIFVTGCHRSSHELFANIQDQINHSDHIAYNDIYIFENETSYLREQRIKNDLITVDFDKEFQLYAQPIVNILDKEVEGLEILLRWIHPELGLIGPGDFIPYAEITGQIKSIDLWVLSRSLDFIQNHTDSLGAMRIHINISSSSLENKDLVEVFRKYTQDRLSGQVIVEITEEANTEVLTEAYASIKALGYSFAIDDFGSGFSSFDRMRRTGVSYLKIDKTFIESIEENPNDIILLKAMLSMCQNLNIKVIVEGVERLEQVEFLMARQSYLIQGYYFAKPLPILDLVTKLEDVNKRVIQKLQPLASNNLVGRQFYNEGRLYLQRVDSDLCVLEPNIQLMKKLGYKLEEVLKQNVSLFIVEDEWEYFLEALSNDQGEESVFHSRIFSKQGQEFPVRFAVKGEGHGYDLYIEFLEFDRTDMGELAGLSRSYIENFYRSPVATMILDSNYRLLKINTRARELFRGVQGFDGGGSILGLIDDEDRSLAKSFAQASSKSIVETTYIRKELSQDQYLHWTISSLVDLKTGDHRYICIVQDITEKVLLNEEKSIIYNALDQSESMIVMTDLDGRVQYVNQKFIAFTGYNKEEILGNNMGLLSSDHEEDEVYKKMWASLERGESWTGELKNKKKNGDYYWCKENIYPLVEAGQVKGYIGIQVDVTQEKALIEDNVELKTRLLEQDKIASLGMLTSGIMHEINNPLAFVQGNISYLMETVEELTWSDSDDQEDFIEALTDIAKGIRQIKDIAEGLKRYIFKAEDERKEEVDLVNAINEVLVLTRNEYKYHTSVDLIYDDQADYRVMGYAAKLKQVLLNLIINATHAIKARQEGDLGAIKIRLENIENTCCVSVEDNGIGMSQATQDKIFEIFFTTKELGVGTGLGLSVSKKIIEEEHGGILTCSSQLGIGTTFTIRLNMFE